MSLNTTEKKFTQKPLVPEGNHPARCYSIVDVGTQQGSFMGKPKEKPKLIITWEFPDFMHTFDEKKGAQPLVVSHKYNVSLAPKSTLFKMLSSWRNTKEVGSGAGFLKIYIGQWCLASVVHNPDKKNPDIKYANIAGGDYGGENITPLPKMMKDLYKNKPVMNPQVYFDFDEFSIETLEKLPEWQKIMIQVSPEWKKSEAKLNGVVSQPTATTANSIHVSDDVNDDEPF